MAGRPLRQLRNSLLRNPLVGWEDLSGMSPRQAREPLMVLVKPGAEARYAEVYNRVGLPLAVVLHPAGSYPWFGPEPDQQAQADAAFEHRLAEEVAAEKQTAKRLNAIVLSVTVEGRLSAPYYATPDQRRGSTERFSPHTPFVLLHRLGDVLMRGGRTAASKMVTELRREARRRANKKRRRIDYLSRGVDTAAGRMGVIDEDYLSDLWAKWLITGRVAYSPTNPPPESAEEANFRNMLAEYAPQIFRIWHDYLMQAIPVVIHL